MVHFLSNHKDIFYLKEYFPGEEIEVIPHPHLSPNWTAEDIEVNCKDVIEKAVQAEKLIMNGDYTLVGMILLKRSHAGEWTGFLSMKKESSPDAQKSSGIRWIR
jgi:hypothetical protein